MVMCLREKWESGGGVTHTHRERARARARAREREREVIQTAL